MTTFDSLLTAVQSLKCPHGELWFRGHADKDWPLLPSLLRYSSAVPQEKNMLHRFRSQAMAMVPHAPSDNDPARWLFLMQHHGLPTRLLDWTESALTALFFAVSEHDDRDGCIHLLSPIALNASQTTEAVLYPPGHGPAAELMLASFQGTEKPAKVLALMAYASNDRIARQRGNFTVHGMDSDLRDLLKPEWSSVFVVPAERKASLREDLAYFGVTRTSLFNDLVSLAQDLRGQHNAGSQVTHPK